MGMAVLMDTADCRSNAVLRRKPAFRLSTAVGPGTRDMETMTADCWALSRAWST
jgi:hypothetical protein